MPAAALDFDLSLGGVRLSGALPLERLSRAFEQLVARNEESRAAESAPPGLVVRRSCPYCQASIFQLTRIERADGSQVRACRSCRGTFPLGR